MEHKLHSPIPMLIIFSFFSHSIRDGPMSLEGWLCGTSDYIAISMLMDIELSPRINIYVPLKTLIHWWYVDDIACISWIYGQPNKIFYASGISSTWKTTSFSTGPTQIGSTIRPLEELSTSAYALIEIFFLGSIANYDILSYYITLKEIIVNIIPLSIWTLQTRVWYIWTSIWRAILWGWLRYLSSSLRNVR